MNKIFTKSLIGTLILLVGLVGMLAACGNTISSNIEEPVPAIPTVTPLPDGASPDQPTATATAIPEPTQPPPTATPHPVVQPAPPVPTAKPAPPSNGKEDEQGNGKNKGKGKKGD